MSYEIVEDIRNYIGITGNTYDTFLSDAVDFASELADDWSGRDFHDVLPATGFNTHSVTETFYLDDEVDHVLLREWPVQSVQTVLEGTTAIASSRYTIDNRIGKLTFLDASGYREFRGPKITVTYVGGFDSVPWGVRMFIRRAVGYMFAKRDAEGIGADLVGETQVTFRNDRELRRIWEETASQFELDVMT